MASIDSATLTVGRTIGEQEFARVVLDVRWSEAEVALDQGYEVKAFLLERDCQRDTIVMEPSGYIRNIADPGECSKLDDMTGMIGRTSVRPDGQTQATVQLEVTAEFGTNEAGVEEYYAVATIVPEAHGDMRISNEVKIDLEPSA